MYYFLVLGLQMICFYLLIFAALKFFLVYISLLYTHEPHYLGDAVSTADGCLHWMTAGTALLLQRHCLVDELTGRQLEGRWWWNKFLFGSKNKSLKLVTDFGVCDVCGNTGCHVAFKFVFMYKTGTTQLEHNH